jgi:hypothetical protein
MTRLHTIARALGTTNPAAFRALPSFDQAALLAEATSQIDLVGIVRDNAVELAEFIRLVLNDEAAGRSPVLRHAVLGGRLMRLVKAALKEVVLDELVELDHQTLRARA